MSKWESVLPRIAVELDAIDEAWLAETAESIQGKAKEYVRVDTGKTRGSYDVKLIKDEKKALVGSGEDNAIYEEYGTGIHAENGMGRKTPWRFKTKDGTWRWTRGKTATRPLRNGYEDVAPTAAEAYARLCENRIKGM